MSNLHHLDIEGCVYFITSCTEERQTIFSVESCAQVVMDSFLFGRSNLWYYLLGFVVMPNHVHLAIAPRYRKIPWIMQGLKGYTARRINMMINSKGRLWQSGYHDFILNDIPKIKRKLVYIEENPVRLGLVSRATDYKFSSAGRYELLDLAYLA
jgi:REP element-mobilizing transposase RayT